MKQFAYFLVLIICALLLSSCTHHKKPITDESIGLDTVEQTEYQYTPTVEEILEERENLRYSLWADSVYLSIPKPILINILVTKGTQMSIWEMAEEYWQHKQYYHDTILNTIAIQHKYVPDSIPKKSIPDISLQHTSDVTKH